jgi:two-component system cell cycle sensor histidine kinase/response regulator CckA
MSPALLPLLAALPVSSSWLGPLLAFLGLLAAVSVALWARRWRRQARIRWREVALLNQVIAAGGAAREPTDVLEVTCRELASAFDLPHASAALVDPGCSRVRIVAEVLPPGRAASVGTVISLADDPPLEYVLAHKVPLAVPELAHKGLASSSFQPALHRVQASRLILPLVVRGEGIGTITLSASQPRPFSDEEVVIASNAAAAAAHVLENAELLSAERHARQLSDTLSEIARELNTAPDLESALDLVLSSMGRVIALDSGSILLLEGDHMRVVALKGFEHPEHVLLARLDLGVAELNREVVASRRPLIVGSVANDPRWLESIEASQLTADLCRIQSWMGVPLLIQDRVTGMLTADKQEPNFYRPEHAELALAFAGHAAVAIENARLLESGRAQLQLARTLQQVGALLTTRMTSGEVMEQIFDLLAHVVSYDSVSVQLLNDEGRLEITAGRGFPDLGLAHDVMHSIGDEAMQQRWAEQQAIVIADTRHDDRWIDVPQVSYIRSWIGAPLCIKGRLIGVLNVDSAIPNAYSEETADMVMAFANQAAVAIENARLYEQAQSEIRVRERVEREMTERQVYLESVLAAAPDAIVTLDADHNVLEWNPGAERLFGYSRSQAVGRQLDPLISSPEILDEAVALTRRVLNKQHVAPHECVRYRHDGTPVHVLVAGSPIVIGDDLIGAVAAYTDIGERVRAEEEAVRRATQQEALNAIIAAAAGATDVQDLLDGALDHTMRAFALERGIIQTLDHQAVGRLPRGLQAEHLALPADAAGSSVRTCAIGDLSSREVPEDFDDAAAELLDSGARSILSVPILAGDRIIGELAVADQEPRSWSSEEIALLGAVGRQLGTGIERLRLLERIRDHVAQVHRIVDTVPEGVLLLGPGSHIILANPAAREYLKVLAGVSVGERLIHLGGRPLADLLTPPAPGQRGHEISVEGPSPAIFEVTARPIETEAEGEGWVLVLHDVGEARKLQQQVQQHERLAAVGQLAAGIAHDFNNIMAVIVLYTQMALLSTALHPKDRERLSTILNQARRATDLIQQILDFSRRSVLERQPMHINSFLKELVRLLDRTLPENIHLELDCDQCDYTVSADPTRMQQMIMNLALNSRDAMPDGGLLHIGLQQLSVSRTDAPPVPEMAPGKWIRIQVTDSGTGIPPDILPRIFEPFFTTKAPLGTGLGLSQVYGIVRQHGGFVDAESPSTVLSALTGQSGGTTFTICLPSAASDLAWKPYQDLSAVPEGTGELILVVEDDAATREALIDSLELLNYRALSASDGSEALRQCEEHLGEIALVLSDLVMPEMGGSALFAEIDARYNGMKVVAMTGHPLDESPEGRPAGVIDWLQKPIGLDELGRALERALRPAEGEMVGAGRGLPAQ